MKLPSMTGMLIADRLQSEEAVGVLRDLGCYRIWIGSESGSQRILDSMERGVTVEQVQSAVSACKTRGIQSSRPALAGSQRRAEPLSE